MNQPWWRWIAWTGFLVLLAFIGLVGFDHVRKKSLIKLEILKRKNEAEAVWDDLLNESKAGPLPKTFEKVTDRLYQSLDEQFGITSRALQIRDLAKVLTEQHGMTPDQCKIISQIIDFSEMIRFASQTQTPDDALRSSAREMIEKAKNLCTAISSNKLDS